MASYTIELRKIIDYYGREEVENWFKSYDINDYLLPEQIQQLEQFPNIWNKDKLAKSSVVDQLVRQAIRYLQKEDHDGDNEGI